MKTALANSIQAVSRRQVRSSLVPTQSHLVASTSRTTANWEQRRTAWSPVEWFRKSIAPQLRAKDSDKEIEEARQNAKERGEASVFEYDEADAIQPIEGKPAASREFLQVKKPTEHRGATKNFHISHRKLNKLAHQISGKPVDTAILQMIFSEKRASGRIKSMLAQAKGSAVARGMDPGRLIVSEAWVNKGEGGRMNKRVEIKGRGKLGIQTKYSAKMVVMLREGLTFEEKRQKDRGAKLKRIVSSGLNREDAPLRNPASQWAW